MTDVIKNCIQFMQTSKDVVEAMLSTTGTEISDQTTFQDLLDAYLASGMAPQLAVNYAANNVSIQDLQTLGAMSHHSSEYAWQAPQTSTEFDE